MPDDEDDDDLDTPESNQGPSNQPTNAAVIPEPAQASPMVPAAAAPEGAREEGVQQVKHSEWKRIKQEQRARGRREATAELDAKAKSKGFASYEHALQELDRLRAPAPQAAPAAPATVAPTPQQTPTTEEEPEMPKPQTPVNDKNATRDAAERLRLQEERAKERKQWRASERKNRELQQQLDARDAEMHLREELYRSGVTDTDYALRLLTRELEGKTEEEITAFDRSKFYEGLRTSRPYLFGEKVVPATTGTSGTKTDGTSPPPPAPGAVAADAAQAGKFDARKAKPEEVSARLRELGLNPHL